MADGKGPGVGGGGTARVPERETGDAAPLDLSVVVPYYDEAENLEILVEEIRSALAERPERWELLLMDDGSTDGGGATADALAADDPRVRSLRLEANSGQSAALVAGFRAARGEVVVTLDADLQNDPADIPRLLDRVGRWDVVCGVRGERRDSWVRRVSSRVANWARNRVTRESIADVGCSLRAMRRDPLLRVPVFDGMHRFLPTLLRMQGATVTEIPVNHRPRRHGQSKYGIGNRLWRGIRDLLGVRWLQQRAVPPGAAREAGAGERGSAGGESRGEGARTGPPASG